MRHVWHIWRKRKISVIFSENKEIYVLRKETIEKIFATAKEQDGLRYTQYIGKAQMEIFVNRNIKSISQKEFITIKQEIITSKKAFVKNMLIW